MVRKKATTKQTGRIDGYKNNNSKNQIAIFREESTSVLAGLHVVGNIIDMLFQFLNR